MGWGFCCSKKAKNAFKGLVDVLYDVEHGIAMDPMKGKWASSRIVLGTSSYFAFLR